MASSESNVSNKFAAALCGKLSYIVSSGNVNKDNINEQNEDGRTMLYCAARNGHLNVVQWLVEHGADINCLESHGSTPLHGASFYGHEQVVQYLTTQKSCDKSIKNMYNLTAAEESKHEDINSLITKHNLRSTKRFLTDKSNLPAFGFKIQSMEISYESDDDDEKEENGYVKKWQTKLKHLLRVCHSVFKHWQKEDEAQLLKRLKGDKELFEKLSKYHDNIYCKLVTNGDNNMEKTCKIKYSIFNTKIEENEKNQNNLIKNKEKNNDYIREQAIFNYNFMYDPLFYYLTIQDIKNYLPDIAKQLTEIFNSIINNIVLKKFDKNAKLFEQFYFIIVKIYTMETILYKQLHSDIGTSNFKISQLKHFCFALDFGLHRYCDAWEDICYRSVSLTKDQVNLFDIESKDNRKKLKQKEKESSDLEDEDEICQVIHLPHFSSASKDVNVALGWTGNAILIIVPDLKRNAHCGAYDVSGISACPWEKEVLIPWRNQYSCGKVIDIDKCAKCQDPLQIDQEIVNQDEKEIAKKLYAKYEEQIVKLFDQIKNNKVETKARVLIIIQKGWFNHRQLEKINQQRMT